MGNNLQPEGQSFGRKLDMGVSKYKESAPEAYYHLYNRGNQKNLIFKEKNDYSYYLHRLRKAINNFDFSIICYCFMPNHIHLIVRQNGLVSPSKLIASIHTSYAMFFNKKYKQVGHLFQDRFKQKIILDDDYILNLIAYIHYNPVSSKICLHPKDYIWSSYNEYNGSSRYPFCNHELLNGYNLKGQSFDDFIKSAKSIDPLDAFDE